LGATLSENQKEQQAIKKIKSESEINSLFIEIPADFIAIISYCSPNEPKVISEDKSTARGAAKETKVAEA
jgi:hypothetical protein